MLGTATQFDFYGGRRNQMEFQPRIAADLQVMAGEFFNAAL